MATDVQHKLAKSHSLCGPTASSAQYWTCPHTTQSPLLSPPYSALMPRRCSQEQSGELCRDAFLGAQNPRVRGFKIARSGRSLATFASDVRSMTHTNRWNSYSRACAPVAPPSIVKVVKNAKVACQLNLTKPHAENLSKRRLNMPAARKWDRRS